LVDDTLNIDDRVLKTLLDDNVKYRHGARSIEAVLDMSRLAGKRRLDWRIWHRVINSVST